MVNDAPNGSVGCPHPTSVQIGTVNKFTHTHIYGMDFHGYEKQTKKYIKRIESDKDILKVNQKILVEYLASMRHEQLSWGAVYKYMWLLYHFGKKCSKSFLKMNDKDMQKILASFEGYGIKKPWNEGTHIALRESIQRFFKWLKKDHEEVQVDPKNIKIKYSKRHKLPEELLTRDEINLLIDHCDNIRDKALVYVLYESGARIGELLGLRLKHLQADKYGFTLRVDGKTGQRRIRIIESVPILRLWLENHPFKFDKDADLWITEKNQYKNEVPYSTLGYRGAYKVLERAGKRAGIQKNIYPHLFRHSRATFLSKHLKEAQMREMFGWAKNSDMPSVYIHLSGRDVDEGLLKLYGIEDDENKETMKIDILKCSVCGEQNSSRLLFCIKCASPLHNKEFDRNQKVESLIISFLEVIGQEFPQIKTKFAEAVKEREIMEAFEMKDMTHLNI